MLKRTLVVAFTGAAIALNTTTTIILGSVALATIKKVVAVVDELSAAHAATARARVSSLKFTTRATQAHAEIPKTRNMVGRPGPLHSLIVR